MNKYINSDYPIAVVSGTELDLLSTYLTNQRDFSFRIDGSKNKISVFEFDGSWDIYIKCAEVERKKKPTT